MEQESEYVILGGCDGIGYAFAKCLLAQKVTFTMVVSREELVCSVFYASPLVQIVYGRYDDAQVLTEAARGKKFLFFAGDRVHGRQPQTHTFIIANIISVAARWNLLLIYPGDICQFSGSGIITEKTFPAPVTTRGLLETQIEDLLLQSAVEMRCRVLIVRLPVLWGPNSTDSVILDLFRINLHPKAIYFPVNADIPMQFAYSEDVAALIFKLIYHDVSLPFRVYNYSGGKVMTVRSFAEEISRVTGVSRNMVIINRWVICILSVFSSQWSQIKSRLPCFRKSFVLDGSLVDTIFPGQKETGIDEAIDTTVTWLSGKDSGRAGC
jgi:nucleoside-diphosphate-sugar epimerase